MPIGSSHFDYYKMCNEGEEAVFELSLNRSALLWHTGLGLRQVDRRTPWHAITALEVELLSVAGLE